MNIDHGDNSLGTLMVILVDALSAAAADAAAVDGAAALGAGAG